MLKSSFHPMQAIRCTSHSHQTLTVPLADEVAIALTYGGTTHAVMMATPNNLHDFAVGFSLTEGLITAAHEIESINILDMEEGIDIQMRLEEGQRMAFQARRRHMAGPVGCGLCGIESIEAAMRHLPRIKANLQLDPEEISTAFNALSHAQKLNDATRCAHAAGFYVKGRSLVAIREDIGRHNALDKLIGALTRAKENIGEGMIIVTSRLSVEMVQKAAIAGAPILAAVSAPTAEAVRNGHKANMTLIARARGEQFEIYTNPQRIFGRDII